MTAGERLLLLSGREGFKDRIISGGFTTETADYPDFSLTAATDEGLIRRTLDDSTHVWYFRGAATNNYATLGAASDGTPLNWRIVGITPAGNVRMIFSGSIGRSIFGSATESGAMNLYYYRSAAKSAVELWFNSTNLGGLFASGILADDIFYNDVEPYSTVSGRTEYMARYRLWSSYGNFAPAVRARAEDAVSVANGKAGVPAALLTVDEAAMAGLVNGTANAACYLGTLTSWSMSASVYTLAGAAMPSTYGLKIGSDGQQIEYAIRPVINVNGAASMSGAGTALSPYTLRLDTAPIDEEDSPETPVH